MGYIIIYDTSSKSGATRIYRELMGRIVSIKNRKYYYPGLFHDVYFYKIKNGCYYTCDHIDTSTIPVKILSANIEVPKNSMMDAYSYWKKTAEEKNLNVRGL